MITLNDVEIRKMEVNDDYKPAKVDVTISYRPEENRPDCTEVVLTVAMDEAKNLKIGNSTDITVTNIPLPDAS